VTSDSCMYKFCSLLLPYYLIADSLAPSQQRDPASSRTLVCSLAPPFRAFPSPPRPAHFLEVSFYPSLQVGEDALFVSTLAALGPVLK
jgi:hypothetical protein